MHKYDCVDIGSSTPTFSDSGSNWSKSARKGKYGTKTKCKKKPQKNKTNSSKKPKLKTHVRKNCRQTDFSLPQPPRLGLNKYQLRLNQFANFEQTKKLVERINTEAELVAYLWPRCQQRTRELEAELAELQQRAQKLQVETIEIKRKRWCRVCQKEANYIHAMRFFCSSTCELTYTHNPVDTIPPIG